MTTLADRPNSALVVIDVQVGVVAEAWERDAVVARIAGLVQRARMAGVPVVWVQHSGEHLPAGSPAWQIVPELQPSAGEPLIAKLYGDSFQETDLEETLAELRVGRVYISGAQTDQCVRGTLHSALVRGYDTILVSDAHTTEDATSWGAPPPELVVAHTNLYWTYEEAPGRSCGTVAAAHLEFESP